MKMKHRIGEALLAVALITSATIATTTPAEAITVSQVRHCVWPGKATFDLVNDSASYGYEWKAYSPTGWFLGSYWGRTWYTPWEDATVVVKSNDTYYQTVSWCR